MNTRSFWLSTLIAGAAIALFGNLPVFNLINCALCIWVWFGGALSVFLYRRFQGGRGPLSTEEQAASLKALARSRPYVDASRVAVGAGAAAARTR